MTWTARARSWAATSQSARDRAAAAPSRRCRIWPRTSTSHKRRASKGVRFVTPAASGPLARWTRASRTGLNGYVSAITTRAAAIPRCRRWAAKAGLFSSACRTAAGKGRVVGVRTEDNGAVGARSAANSSPGSRHPVAASASRHARAAHERRPGAAGRNVIDCSPREAATIRPGVPDMALGGIDRMCGPTGGNRLPGELVPQEGLGRRPTGRRPCPSPPPSPSPSGRQGAAGSSAFTWG